MWLPKDERRFLQSYYVNIGQYNSEKSFHIMDWEPVVKTKFIKRTARCVKSIGEREQEVHAGTGYEDLKKKMIQILKDEKVITETNKMLEARGLITLRSNQPTSNVIGITLTLDGYDLGRKYNCWWSRSNLWYSEYLKHHWICVIVGFLCGIVSGLLIKWLSSKIFG
jgi:hypothetical protein